MAKKIETTEATVETTATPSFDAAAYVRKCGSKSAAIRKLHADGRSRGDIAKLLGLRYQHVRNVLITPVKKAATPNG
jgi:c-di-AMP phosphodiesterase-like protein